MQHDLQNRNPALAPDRAGQIQSRNRFIDDGRQLFVKLTYSVQILKRIDPPYGRDEEPRSPRR
jgi:hypothetical protein